MAPGWKWQKISSGGMKMCRCRRRWVLQTRREQRLVKMEFRRALMRMKTVGQLVLMTDLRWCKASWRGGQFSQQELSKWGEVCCWWLRTRETCRIVGSLEGILVSLLAPLSSPPCDLLLKMRGDMQSSRCNARQPGTPVMEVWCCSPWGFWYGPWSTFPGP